MFIGTLKITVVRDGDAPGSAADRALQEGIDRLLLSGHEVHITARPPLGLDANSILEEGGVDGLVVFLDSAAPAALSLEGEIEKLATLAQLDYARIRRGEAKRLGIPVAILDDEVRKARDRLNAASAPDTEDDWATVQDTPVWFTPVDGVELLNELDKTIGEFIVMIPEQRWTVALWVVFTHCFSAANNAPKLWIKSAERRSGKTRLIELLRHLTARALASNYISAAMLPRVIEQYQPTLLLDEVDTFINSSEELRGTLIADLTPTALSLSAQRLETTGSRSSSLPGVRRHWRGSASFPRRSRIAVSRSILNANRANRKWPDCAAGTLGHYRYWRKSWRGGPRTTASTWPRLSLTCPASTTEPLMRGSSALPSPTGRVGTGDRGLDRQRCGLVVMRLQWRRACVCNCSPISGTRSPPVRRSIKRQMTPSSRVTISPNGWANWKSAPGLNSSGAGRSREHNWRVSWHRSTYRPARSASAVTRLRDTRRSRSRRHFLDICHLSPLFKPSHRHRPRKTTKNRQILKRHRRVCVTFRKTPKTPVFLWPVTV